jgi:hypothetical protein
MVYFCESERRQRRATTTAYEPQPVPDVPFPQQMRYEPPEPVQVCVYQVRPWVVAIVVFVAWVCLRVVEWMVGK